MIINEFHDYENEIRELHNDCILLVDFYTNSCPMCKSLDKTLNELQDEFNNLEIIKIDAEKNPEMTEEFEVKSVPTLLITKNAVLLEIIIGNISKNQLKEKLEIYNG